MGREKKARGERRKKCKLGIDPGTFCVNIGYSCLSSWRYASISQK